MGTVKLQKLTKEAFSPFGEYYVMNKPEGYALCGELHRFFPDRVTVNPSTKSMAFSPIMVKKPEKMHITQVEYHTTTAEIFAWRYTVNLFKVAIKRGGGIKPTIVK